MSDPAPVALSATASDLLITWSDGLKATIAWRRLRDQCPCANCRIARAAPPADLPVLTPQEAGPIRGTAMNPVGNYAYQIEFSDGHRTGIFSFDFLRDLSTRTSV